MTPHEVERRRSLRAAGFSQEDIDNPNLVLVVIKPADPNAPPIKWPPSSRTIARQREKAAAATRAAAAAQALAKQIMPGLRPPAGKLFSFDVAGMLLCGPLGAIGSSARMVQTLAPLAAGGRHQAAELIAAGSWQDEATLIEALDGMAGKLGALGLRICRKKTGLRMAKGKPAEVAT